MSRLLVPVLCVILAGCGALFNGGPANVAFNSDPSGAQILIDGTARGTTPATLSLAKNKSYLVTFKKAGFQDASAEITRKVSGGYIVLDILGGVLPVVVDAATGSWYVLSTENVSMNLRNATAMQGQLTPEKLAALKYGVPMDKLVNLDALMSAGEQ